MNKSKAKGTRAESAVVKFMAGYGIVAKRKALAGSSDKGDLDVVVPGLGRDCIFEVKAGAMTSNPSRAQLEEWMRQTRVEAENADAHGCLCVVRYNRKLADADVWWEIVPGIWSHAFLSDWCGYYRQ